MNKSLFNMAVLLFVLMYFTPSRAQVESSSPEVFKLSSIGVAYGAIELENSDLSYILEGKPGRLIIDMTAYTGNLGVKIFAWAINQNIKYGLGSFEESGAAFCFTPNINIGNSNLRLIFYGDGGIGYQKTKMSLTYDYSNNNEAQNSGFAIVYGGGAELVFLNRLIVYSDFKIISSKAGDLDVGNSGISFGLKWAFSNN